MSRPSLGYSNYYWIKKDRMKLEKQQKKIADSVAEEKVTEDKEEKVETEEKVVSTALSKPHNFSFNFGKENE